MSITSRPSVFPVAFLFMAATSLSACSNTIRKADSPAEVASASAAVYDIEAEQRQLKFSSDENSATIKTLDAGMRALDDSIKTLDANMQALNMNMQAMDEKVQSFDGRLQSLEQASQIQLAQIKAMSATLQKLKRNKTAAGKKKPARSVARKHVQKKPVKAVKVPVAPPAVAVNKTADEEKNAYTAAYLALKSGHYDEASKAFGALLDQHPKGEFADQAWYWLGESSYAQHNHKKAINAFKYVAKNFLKSVKHGAALYKLGQISQSLEQDKAAAGYYRRLIREHGDSSIAEQARVALAEMKNKSAGGTGK